jgi:hypothetical protein
MLRGKRAVIQNTELTGVSAVAAAGICRSALLTATLPSLYRNVITRQSMFSTFQVRLSRCDLAGSLMSFA